MSFQEELELTDRLLAPGPDQVPAFVRTVAGRLRREYGPGEGYRFAVGRRVLQTTMQCHVNAWQGLTRGFRVTFDLELPDLKKGKVKVERYSRLTRGLLWVGVVLGGVATAAVGVASIAGWIKHVPTQGLVCIGTAMVCVSGGAGWLAGMLATLVMGGGLPNEQLNEIGRTVLAAIDEMAKR